MAANGQDPQRESHLISLKVMRLSRPSLVTGHALYFGAPHQTSSPVWTSPTPASPSQGHDRPNMSSILTEALSDLSLSQLERVHPPSSSRLIPPTGDSQDSKDVFESVDMGDFGVSELLTMPASFGNIYLGETFTSYICANNESAHPVRDVILKAELQTSTLRFALSDTLSAQHHAQQQQQAGHSPSEAPSSGGYIQLLESGRTNEMIVSHEIKELGIHILVCSIQYTTLDGQQKSFRKFYKFQVLNPLSVKTKVNHPSSTTLTVKDGGGRSENSPGGNAVSKGGGLVLLEAMVQNVSGVTMWMERMKFEVADAFTVKDLNVAMDDNDEELDKGKGNESVSIFGEHDYFAPNDIRQYLYVLSPKPGKEMMAKTTNVLGKMDILWRSQFGETGRLQTSQLTRKPAPLDDISVQVVKMPERIRLEEIFTIEIVVKNQSLGGPQQSSGNATQSNRAQQPAQTAPQYPSGSMTAGTLARPPAAVARGGAPPSRTADSGPNASQNTLTQSSSNFVQDQNAMKLMLTGVKQKMGAVLLSGPNSRQLGAVPSGGEVRVRLDWFPLTSGVQKIGGIRIVDIISGYAVELDHLTHCFVEHT